MRDGEAGETRREREKEREREREEWRTAAAAAADRRESNVSEFKLRSYDFHRLIAHALTQIDRISVHSVLENRLKFRIQCVTEVRVYVHRALHD